MSTSFVDSDGTTRFRGEIVPVPGGGGIAAPTEIPGLLVWLDAARLPGVHGDPITTWPDLSGNGFDAAQAVADNKPTLDKTTIPPLPFVNFDPSVNTQWLAFSGDALGMFSGVPGITLCFVLANRDGASASALLGATVPANNNRVFVQTYGGSPYGLEAVAYNDDVSDSYVRAQGGAYQEGDSGTWAATAGVISFDLTTGFSSAWEGGVKALLPSALGGSHAAAANVLLTLGPTTATACDAILLSGDGGAVFNGWDGGVIAVMIYGRALTASERRQLLEYVGATYNVA